MISPSRSKQRSAAWLRAAASIGIDAAALEMVKVSQSLSPRDDDGPLLEPRSAVIATCREEGT